MKINARDVLPLFFKIEGLSIKTYKIEKPVTEVNRYLLFKYTTIMSINKEGNWALVDLYNEEKQAISNHFRWCMDLSKIYVDMKVNNGGEKCG